MDRFERMLQDLIYKCEKINSKEGKAFTDLGKIKMVPLYW